MGTRAFRGPDGEARGMSDEEETETRQPRREKSEKRGRREGRRGETWVVLSPITWCVSGRSGRPGGKGGRLSSKLRSARPSTRRAGCDPVPIFGTLPCKRVEPREVAETSSKQRGRRGFGIFLLAMILGF